MKIIKMKFLIKYTYIQEIIFHEKSSENLTFHKLGWQASGWQCLNITTFYEVLIIVTVMQSRI